MGKWSVPHPCLQAERNAAICEAYKAGRTLQQIGDEYSMTRERVRQIVRSAGITRHEGGQFIGMLRKAEQLAQIKAARLAKRNAWLDNIVAAWIAGESWEKIAHDNGWSTYQSFPRHVKEVAQKIGRTEIASFVFTSEGASHAAYRNGQLRRRNNEARA